MYDAAPVTGRRSGDPIADCFVTLGYANGALLAVADGVNWGEPARRAARCAVLGATAHLHAALQRLIKDSSASPENGHAAAPSTSAPSSSTSSDVIFGEMVNAVHAAQQLIKRQCGTMTTLVLTMVLPIAAPASDSSAHPSTASSSSHTPTSAARPMSSRLMSKLGRKPSSSELGDADASSSGRSGQWVALTLTVGDSPAYVWRPSTGRVQELTAASHAGSIRDPRWTPGALGYALGDDPDLANMTASITRLAAGDIVFLASDGVADNFDPIILKTARRAPYASELNAVADAEPGPPMLTPEEVDAAALRAIQAAIAAIAGSGGAPGGAGGSSGSKGRGKPAPPATQLTARELVEGLLKHVYQATEEQRAYVEETAAKAAERAAEAAAARAASAGGRSLSTDGPRRASINNIAVSLPGKMDHATVAAFQVGHRPERAAV